MLKNKKALITGSTSGIGLAMAHMFAAQGAAVMIHGLIPTKQLDELQSQLAKKYGVPVLASNADLAKENDLMGLAEQVLSEWGHLDILINNAGTQHMSPIESFPSEKWEQVMTVNLHAPFYLTRMFMTGMKQTGWGRVINIASSHGLVGSPQRAAYVASKHALVGLTKAVALETASDHITCNAICPGWVDSEWTDHLIQLRAKQDSISTDQARIDMVTEKHPTKEYIAPDDIASLALYLCGPHARGITGAALSIDGGWTAQ